MDHAGAVAGPLIAAQEVATFAGLSLRTVFLLAAIPAVIVILVLAAGVNEGPVPARAKRSTASATTSWSLLNRDFRVLLVATLLFTLGNSSDAFVLLRLSDSGVPGAWIAVLWALHHVVKMVFAYLGGTLSDTLGRRRVILMGWFVYALVYLAFGYFENPALLIAVFLAYGLYFGLTEPCEKAWVADLAPANARGTALGWYKKRHRWHRCSACEPALRIHLGPFRHPRGVHNGSRLCAGCLSTIAACRGARTRRAGVSDSLAEGLSGTRIQHTHHRCLLFAPARGPE